MRRFNSIIFKEKVAIHCHTKKQAKELFDYAHFKGCKWRGGYSYLEHVFWNNDIEGTCYSLSVGTHANKDIYVSDNYTVIPFDLVAEDYFPVLEGKELKVGDTIWSKTFGKYITIDSLTNNSIIDGRCGYSLKNRLTPFDGLDSHCSWTKPEPEIKYTLPNFDGEQEEVKVGQQLYCKYDNYKRIIYELRNNRIYYSINGIKRDYMYVENVTGENLNELVFTIYPQRDFHQFYHWGEVDKMYEYATVDKDGTVCYWVKKPTLSNKYWTIETMDEEYDIESHINVKTLNEHGICEDWKYSLCQRPEIK